MGTYRGRRASIPMKDVYEIVTAEAYSGPQKALYLRKEEGSALKVKELLSDEDACVPCSV
jgi:hypothetical protein